MTARQRHMRTASSPANILRAREIFSMSPFIITYHYILGCPSFFSLASSLVQRARTISRAVRWHRKSNIGPKWRAPGQVRPDKGQPHFLFNKGISLLNQETWCIWCSARYLTKSFRILWWAGWRNAEIGIVTSCLPHKLLRNGLMSVSDIALQTFYQHSRQSKLSQVLPIPLWGVEPLLLASRSASPIHTYPPPLPQAVLSFVSGPWIMGLPHLEHSSFTNATSLASQLRGNFHKEAFSDHHPRNWTRCSPLGHPSTCAPKHAHHSSSQVLFMLLVTGLYSSFDYKFHDRRDMTTLLTILSLISSTMIGIL